MNLADPELELIDPTPNIYNLFTHFDQIFFYTSLVGRALVRWSKRMYSCAGICSYEGRNGLCDIALSEPLLKLRPRKDLVETLLHEMIHAYLFITKRDNDRDGHGPNFQAHMHRINKAAGLNISIYHDFHDEVKLYLKHWWRCNGKCQKMRPYFGVVRRVANRPPGPNDYWWSAHQRICGGMFIKIKEPEKKQKTTKKPAKGKINVDITKYINNNKNTSNENAAKPVNSNINKDKQIVNFKVTTVLPVEDTLKTNELKKRRNSNPVIEKVRDVWKNKQIPKTVSATTVIAKPVKSVDDINLNKHKAKDHITSPPKKIKKIDDYFKSTAGNLLKDIYGEEFIISQSHNTNKLRAVVKKDSNDKDVKSVNLNRDLVCCPSCNSMVSNYDINRHLDECLNKEITERLSKESTEIIPSINTTEDKTKLKDIVGNIQRIPSFKSKTANIGQTITIEDSIKVFKTYESSNATIQNKQASNLLQKDNVKPGPSKESILGEMCPCCGIKLDTPLEKHLDHCLQFFNNNDTIPIEATPEMKVIDSELKIKTEPDTSKESIVQKCPCCNSTVDKPIELHLDECLSFFDNDSTIPQEGSSFIETIVIDDDDDDDEFDESQTLNATGTKSPCPCCLKMVEIEEMNDHLDMCLGS